MRITFIFSLLLSFSFSVSAQSINGIITGKVTDSAGLPLDKASVSLLNAEDSSVVVTVFTSEKGDFILNDLNENNYLLLITYLGYQQIQKPITITKNKPRFDLGTTVMKEKPVELKGVTVKQIAPPVTLKGDTLEFNASSFQTRPNAVVEDLLKKIPGVQVEKDGTIKAEGETVNQVLVDGKPFFGKDPKLATKNLPVNIIDKVQVFDKLSDQAAFTGIDDGNTQKAINLTIKKDKKKGLFGRAEAGAGTDDRFSTSLSLFRFNNDQQISLLGSGNNTNQLGFTFNDIRNFNGGGRRGNVRIRRGRSGGSMNGIPIPGTDGVTTNWMTGLNYRDQWGEKISVTGNYFYNHTSNNIIQEQDRQYILPDTSYYNHQSTHSENSSANHRFNLRMEYKIDSMNSIWFTPSLSYTTNEYSTQSDYAAMDNAQNPVNDGSNFYTSSATSPDISGNLLYRRKFNKPGRTLSLNFNGGYNTKDANGINSSVTNYYLKNDLQTDTVDQHFDQDNTRKSWGVRMTYTEPVFEDRILELHAGYNKNLNESDKKTYNQNPVNGKFDQIDSVYSNSFRNTYHAEEAGFNIQTKKLKYNYTIGMNIRQNNLNSYSVTGDSTFGQKTTNLFPQAYFNYTLDQNKRMRFYYRGSTDQPSLSQLQPVPDNTDPLNIKIGNPDLKTSFTNSFRLNYRSFNRSNYRMFFANISFRTVSNDIVNSSTYNNAGQRTIQYVNANGSYNASAFITAGLPLKDSKNMINSHTFINFGKDVGFINEEKNFTHTLSIEQGLSLNYAYKELFDFRISGSVNYSRAHYSLQRSLNTDYFNYRGSLDFNINLPAHFMIQTDFDYTANTGRTDGYNENVAMWNASVQKYFLPKQQMLVKLQAFDLLNQQVSIERNVTANYIEDTRSNVIPQYFMLSLTYFLNKFPGSRHDRHGPPPPGRVFFHRR